MGVEVAFGLLTMTATGAVEVLIVGVVECLLAGVDFRLAVGLGASSRIPDSDPLGIALEMSSRNSRSFSAVSRRAGALSLPFITAPFFRAALSPKPGEPHADFSDA
jgi:hypothetical protein